MKSIELSFFAGIISTENAGGITWVQTYFETESEAISRNLHIQTRGLTISGLF